MMAYKFMNMFCQYNSYIWLKYHECTIAKTEIKYVCIVESEKKNTHTILLEIQNRSSVWVYVACFATRNDRFSTTLFLLLSWTLLYLLNYVEFYITTTFLVSSCKSRISTITHRHFYTYSISTHFYVVLW